MKVRCVNQLLAALSPGDAVSNEALAFQRMLRGRGYESDIFAGAFAPEMANAGLPLTEYESRTKAEAISLFHFAIGTPVADAVLRSDEPLILRYHNVTPHHFFEGFSGHHVGLTYHGARRLARFVPRASIGLAVSEFNRADLVAAGFPRTATLPLALDRQSLLEPPDPFVIERFKDARTNLIFVGRLAPNKKIDDLVRVFCAYQRYVEPESRLFLVGDGRGFERYTRRLRELVSHLRVDEVVFTAAVTQAELNAYYRLSSAFLCLSEHEGYGAPLVEAMSLRLPVIAYDAGAVRETLQGGGVLLSEKSPEVVAELLGRVVGDEKVRQAILDTQVRALEKIQTVDLAQSLAEFVEQAGAER